MMMEALNMVKVFFESRLAVQPGKCKCCGG